MKTGLLCSTAFVFAGPVGMASCPAMTVRKLALPWRNGRVTRALLWRWPTRNGAGFPCKTPDPSMRPMRLRFTTTAVRSAQIEDGRKLTLCATDDAHFTEPDHFGGWTMVKAEEKPPTRFWRP